MNDLIINSVQELLFIKYNSVIEKWIMPPMAKNSKKKKKNIIMV